MYEDLAGDFQPPRDWSDEAAVDRVQRFFDENRQRVFFSRQVEVLHEGEWFHWIINRALRELVDSGEIRTERRTLSTGGSIHLLWHRSYRYYKRDAARVAGLVEEYSHTDIGRALGLQGEALVLEGFASNQFVMHGRDTRQFDDAEWTETEHDLDYIFERDGVAYGVEVKNTLGYMQREELDTKIRLCKTIGVRPLIVARMLPKSWILNVKEAGGFALILKYQLYPWTHQRLARRVREELELPVDAPTRLKEGTMRRFVRWHERRV